MLEDSSEIAAIDPAAAIRALSKMLSLVRRRAVNGLADVFSAGDLSQGSLTSYSKVDDDRVAVAAGPEIAVVGGASVRGANFNAGGAATGGAGGSGYVRITEFNSQ